jgi:hypothetical protein
MTASTLSDNNPSLCYIDVEIHFDRVQVRKVVKRVEMRLDIVGTVKRTVVRYDGVVYLEIVKRKKKICRTNPAHEI